MEIAVGFLRSGLQFVTKSKARDGLKLWSRRCEPGLLAFPWIAGIVFVTLITYQARKGVGWKRMEIWPVKVKVKNKKVPCQCRQHALTSGTKNDHFSGKKNKQTNVLKYRRSPVPCQCWSSLLTERIALGELSLFGQEFTAKGKFCATNRRWAKSCRVVFLRYEV